MLTAYTEVHSLSCQLNTANENFLKDKTLTFRTRMTKKNIVIVQFQDNFSVTTFT